MDSVQDCRHDTLLVQPESNMCWDCLCLEPPLEDRETVLSSLYPSCGGFCFPCSISDDHPKIRCFGHRRQSKWCVRDRELWTMFSPVDPVSSKLRDPFANCTKENNTLGGVNVEPIHTKSMQNMGKVSKGTLSIFHQQCYAMSTCGIFSWTIFIGYSYGHSRRILL